MYEQIQALDLKGGSRVLDLGSGTGDFAVQLATEQRIRRCPYRRCGLRGGGAATSRIPGLGAPVGPSCPSESRFISISTSVLNLHSRSRKPAFDAVLASLVISYVAEPKVLLERIRLAFKPRGRLVISTLRRDADISRLHVDGLAELRAGRAGRGVRTGNRGVDRRDGTQLPQRCFSDSRSGGRGDVPILGSDELRALVRSCRIPSRAVIPRPRRSAPGNCSRCTA